MALRICKYLSIIAFCFFVSTIHSQETINSNYATHLLYPDLVKKFYTDNAHHIFWQTKSLAASEIRNNFIHIIDSSAYLGLNKERYHYSALTKTEPKDSFASARQDILFTDAIIAFCKDVYQGADITKWISNDEVSVKYAVSDNDYLLQKITNIKNSPDLDALVVQLEHTSPDYVLIKEELRKQINIGNKANTDRLVSSINLYRWIHHFNFDNFILVNIPSATLRYYEKDIVKLQMKVVVGKPSTRSPRFATWCN